MIWRLHHRDETESTNLDARAGGHGDVYTADFQTAGRGRLDHRWLSPPGANLMMSAVLSVESLSPEQIVTFPLVAGLSVCEGLAPLDTRLKWPNDVLIGGRKLAGILCERTGDRIIVGIGVNVNQTELAPEIADRATSLALLRQSVPASLPTRLASECSVAVQAVRDAVLARLGANYDEWLTRGFAALYSRIAARDVLKGRSLSVRQTDDDTKPICGISGGILSDGSLDVGGVRVYAGEAHVERIGG